MAVEIKKNSKTIITEPKKTRFTEDDWFSFFDLLDNVPDPTIRMKQAQKKYKNIIDIS